MFISSSDFHPELTLHPVGYLASPLESLRGPTHLGPHGIPDHSSPQSLSPCHPILINKGLRSSPVAQVGAGGCLALSSSNHKSTINSTSCDLLNPSTSCPHHSPGIPTACLMPAVAFPPSNHSPQILEQGFKMWCRLWPCPYLKPFGSSHCTWNQTHMPSPDLHGPCNLTPSLPTSQTSFICSFICSRTWECVFEINRQGSLIYWPWHSINSEGDRK